MKKGILIASLILFCFAIFVYSGERYVVKPIEMWDDMWFANSQRWIGINEMDELDEWTKKEIQIWYVLGFLDAVALFEWYPITMGKWSSECEGMDFLQLRDTINKFYEDYPQWRDRSPATVLARVIPRLRRGLSPFPPDTTEIDIEGLRRDYGIPDSLKKK